jgi:hypothetical protein
MKTKISGLIGFVLLSAVSLTTLFGSSNTQSSGNLQTEPEVTLPGLVSNSSDSGGMRTRADTDLPSVRYGSQINVNQPSLTLDSLDVRSFALKPNQIGVNRSVQISPNIRAQKFVNPDGSQINVLIIRSSGASGIGVHFRNFVLDDGEEVYVYGAGADSTVFGPFTDKDPGAAAIFGLALSMGTRSSSSSIRKLMKPEKGSRFLRYLTFSPSWIGESVPVNPTF